MKQKLNILIIAALFLIIMPIQFGCEEAEELQPQQTEEQETEWGIPESQGIPGELNPGTDGENNQDLLDQITYVNYSTTKSSVTEVVDQSMTDMSSFCTWIIDRDKTIGQSFTPELSSLSAISFYNSYTYISGYAYIDIYEGETTSGTKIAMSNGTDVTGWGWLRFDFPNTVILKTDGTKYSAVIRSTGKWKLPGNKYNVYSEGKVLGDASNIDLDFKTHALAEGDAILAYTDNWVYTSLPSDNDDSQSVVKGHITTAGGRIKSYLSSYYVKNYLLSNNLAKFAFGTAGTVCTIIDFFCGSAGSEHAIELACVNRNTGYTQTTDTYSVYLPNGYFEASVQVGGWSDQNPKAAKIYFYQNRSGNISTLASAYIPRNALAGKEDTEVAMLVFDKSFYAYRGNCQYYARIYYIFDNGSYSNIDQTAKLQTEGF